MKPPFFIIGNPRSGTTLLRLMLHNHKNIVVPPESGFLIWLFERYKDWNLDNIDDHKFVDGFVYDLISAKKFETWELDPDRIKLKIILGRPPCYPALISMIYSQYAEEIGKSINRWGDKNNFYLSHIQEIKNIFTDAVFIHIIRDGRDVAASYRQVMEKGLQSEYAPKLHTELEAIATEWHSNLDQINRSFDAIGWDNVQEVKYESLVLDPKTELMRLCHFLGEPYDEGMMEFYIANSRWQQEPREFLSWKEKTLQPLMSSEIAKFRTQLSSSEIEKFERIAMEMLTHYGYIS